MNYTIYAIFDREAETILGTLMVFLNDVLPVRQLTDMANNPESVIHQHSHAFVLLRVGIINMKTGAITATDPPERVAVAAELKRDQPRPE